MLSAHGIGDIPPEASDAIAAVHSHALALTVVSLVVVELAFFARWVF
jgi:hypothetical protein